MPIQNTYISNTQLLDDEHDIHNQKTDDLSVLATCQSASLVMLSSKFNEHVAHLIMQTGLIEALD